MYRESKRESSVKILLVEDSKPIRRENETVLQQAGYEVICAEDGESALQMAREQRPDLILLDMILPKVSGPEVLQTLKGDGSTAAIPVVVLSSLSEKNRQKLLDAGAEEYLEKIPGNAQPRNEPVAEGAGERNLPHQPQARHRLLQRSRSTLEVRESARPIVFGRKVGARQQQQP